MKLNENLSLKVYKIRNIGNSIFVNFKLLRGTHTYSYCINFDLHNKDNVILNAEGLTTTFSGISHNSLLSNLLNSKEFKQSLMLSIAIATQYCNIKHNTNCKIVVSPSLNTEIIQAIAKILEKTLDKTNKI